MSCQRTQVAPWARLALGLTLVGAACEADPASRDQLPPRSECVIAVVHSDYRSSAISLLTASGQPCAPDIIHSGSRPPGLLTALSGDVVLASSDIVAASPMGQETPVLALIDRYPAGTLTLVDPLTDAVTHQASLSPGYNGNPQDLMSLDPTTVLVSRLEAAPRGATTGPSGSDLALFRVAPAGDVTASGQLIGRMDLAPLANEGFSAMPGRLTRSGPRIFFGLAHLASDFSAAGPGRIAFVDAPTDLATPQLATWLANAKVTAIALEGLENCTEIAASPDGGGVWAVCSGSFRRGSEGQVSRSGLAYIDSNGVVQALFKADVLTTTTGEAAPLGFTLAAIDDHRAVVVALGDLVTKRADRALLVTRPSTSDGVAAAPADVQILHETGAHDLGDALALADTSAVLLADGNPNKPMILHVKIHDQGVPSTAPVALPLASTTGLPPRRLRYFRNP